MSRVADQFNGTRAKTAGLVRYFAAAVERWECVGASVFIEGSADGAADIVKIWGGEPFRGCGATMVLRSASFSRRTWIAPSNAVMHSRLRACSSVGSAEKRPSIPRRSMIAHGGRGTAMASRHHATCGEVITPASPRTLSRAGA